MAGEIEGEADRETYAVIRYSGIRDPYEQVWIRDATNHLSKRLANDMNKILLDKWEEDKFALTKEELMSIEKRFKKAKETVNHPSHYGGVENPLEHVKVAEQMGWHKDAHLYNATKYLWRIGKKANTLENLEKAIWYLTRRRDNEKAEQAAKARKRRR